MVKNIELIKDLLTNISIIVFMLNGRAREAVFYFMCGCCVGESVAMIEKENEEAVMV